MMQEIAQQPVWLQIWIYWLILVNTASIVFVGRRVEARWVLAAWIGNLAFMAYLYDTMGYVRLLGLSHVVLWTPLLVYLYRRHQNERQVREQDADEPVPVAKETKGLARIARAWLFVLFFTNLTSLAVDYVDVARYFIERPQTEERGRDQRHMLIPRPSPR